MLLRLVLQTVLVEGINCRLLHLSEILQSPRAPKQNVIVVKTVSDSLKKVYSFGIPHWLTAIPIIVVSRVLEQIIYRDVITICIIVVSSNIAMPADYC